MKTIELQVDLTESYRRLVHVNVDLPVRPNTTAKFTTPLYLCESHIGNGPVAYIGGLSFSVGSSVLEWRRDPFAPHVYLVDIPAHEDSVHATFDAVLPKFVGRRMSILNWESVLMHPWERPVTEMFVEASIVIPANWEIGTALVTAGLPVVVSDRKSFLFHTVSVERLADSPVLLGEFMSHEDVSSDGRHVLHVSTNRFTVIPKVIIEKISRLVQETIFVFGTPPYRSYHFLLMMGLDRSSPRSISGGAEHSESSFLLFNSDVLLDPEATARDGELIGHEFIHAWNGKYRRPIGHIPSNFTTPLNDSLLWVYEGLTQYYCYILAVRGGLQSPSIAQEKIAEIFAMMANQAGRVWRSTEDVATGDPLIASSPYWRNWLRDSGDFYYEGVLLWLDADTLIRRKSGGNRSLDDFCRAFFGNKDGPYLKPIAYTLDEVIQSLDNVLHHDWASFLRKRVQQINHEANSDGILRSGYRFRFSGSPSFLQSSLSGRLDCVWNSIGLRIDSRGVVEDVKRFGPCDDAKLAPAQIITHVESEEFSLDAMLRHIAHAASRDRRIVVSLKQDDDTWDCTIQCEHGLQYPALERVNEEPDILSTILAPRCQ